MVIAIVNGTSLKRWSYLDYLMFRNGSKIQSKITLCAMINFAFAWKKLPTNNFFRVSTVKWSNSKDFQSIAKRKTIPRGSGYDATTSSNFMIWSFELHIYFSLPEPFFFYWLIFVLKSTTDIYSNFKFMVMSCTIFYCVSRSHRSLVYRKYMMRISNKRLIFVAIYLRQLLRFL